MRRTKSVCLAGLILIMAFNGFGLQTKPSFADITFPSEIEGLIDAATTKVIFLYGIVCVGGCPIGDYVHSIRDKTDVLYVMPPEFTADDIVNFKRGLSVKGRIVQASEKSVEFLKRIATRLNKDDWEQNYVIGLNQKTIVAVDLR